MKTSTFQNHIRLFSALLALLMVLTLTVPAAAVAEEGLPFADVGSDQWFYDAVRYVYDNGIMVGVSQDRFLPGGVTNRAQLVTILHRMEGAPSAEGAAFADVPDGTWYSAAVDWAAENSIVTGHDDGSFRPGDPVNREQAAAILYRYAAYKGCDVSARSGLDAFVDTDAVSGYAKDAMDWAVSVGLIVGMDDGTLAPLGNTNRAQTATLIQRLCGMMEADDDTLSYEGYTLQWQDEFEGESLNREDWNVELHDPGWVNAEWQAYVDSSENIYLEDGSLILKPVKKVDEQGNATYTSGRVNTQGKHDFTYGLFEARVKVPSGMGYLPAFWLMASDENLYGQWPRCGEIDIMEVLGHETAVNYGTIHYGIPHQQRQGKYELESGSLAEGFHTFSLCWEPGRLRWYVDGQCYFEETRWFCDREEMGQVPYPAPFDHEFYLILNLAVGGDWPGDPDETTDFVDSAMEIDHIRVLQR